MCEEKSIIKHTYFIHMRNNVSEKWDFHAWSDDLVNAINIVAAAVTESSICDIALQIDDGEIHLIESINECFRFLHDEGNKLREEETRFQIETESKKKN